MEQSEQNLLTYSLKELCRLADVSERTVRYYITEGLLPPSQGSGLAASYNQQHLYVLLAIRWMKNQYLPLAEIKQRLVDLTPAELKEIAVKSEQIVNSAVGDNALDYLERLRANKKFNTGSSTSTPPNPVPTVATTHTNWPPVGQPVSEEGESWQRINLAPDIELHYRAQANQPERQAKIKQLLEQARRLFQS